MNRMVRKPHLAMLGLMLFAGVVTALGAEEGTLSTWEIIKKGIHWPTYFIFAGSITAVTLIIEHFLTLRMGTISPEKQVKQTKQQIENRNLREALDGLKSSRTYFAQVMTAAMGHARHGFDAMHEAAVEKSGELSGRHFRKVEYLNIIGNLGPLLGLLGTVLGMIKAFGELGAGGGAGSAAGGLAVGISEALVNTMLGLALAIIGLGFFGLCRNRVDALTTHATVQVLDLLEYFRPSSKRSSSNAATASAASE